jgi:hypothetical protein
MTKEKREYLKGYCNGQEDAEHSDHPLVVENLEKAKKCLDKNDVNYPLILSYWTGWLNGFLPLGVDKN